MAMGQGQQPLGEEKQYSKARKLDWKTAKNSGRESKPEIINL